MWIYGTNGFLSIVEDQNDHERFCVRARRREHLENWGIEPRAIFGPQDMDFPPDYPWRAFVDKEVITALVAEATRRIGYPDFKTEAKHEQAKTSPDYVNALGRIWETSHDFEQRN